MKTRLFLIVVLLTSSNISFANSAIERTVLPRRSAIQSTNMVFTNSSSNYQSYNGYGVAINEILSKLKQQPDNYSLNVSLVNLYIKSKQFDKSLDELIYINKLAKNNKLKDDTFNALVQNKKFIEKTLKYYKSPDLYSNLALVNLILQDNESAEESLLKANSSRLFLRAFTEVFNTTGNYQLAIKTADEILLKNPRLMDLRKFKANCCIQLNQIDEAIKELTKVIAAYPQDKDSKYSLYTLLTDKKVSEKELYSSLFPNNKNNYEAIYSELAELLFEHDDLYQSQTYAKKLVEEYPDNAKGYFYLSEIYRSQGKLKESYDALRMVRDRANDADTISKYNVLLAKLSDEPVKEADSLMNNGLYSQALDVLNYANQENLYVMLGQARANYFLDNKQKAFDLLNKSMTLYPNNADVFYYFAYIFYKEGDLVSSRKYINQSLKVAPQHRFALQLLDVVNKAESDKYNGLITSSFEAQNYAETMRLINEALEINKKDSMLYYYQGITYIAMNNYATATASLYKAIELDKNNILAYFYLGLAFDNLSEPDNALSYYKKFISFVPQDDYGESEKITYAKSRIQKLSK